MREIKFRGKHKNSYGDKWVEGYYALLDGEHVIIMPHSTSYEKALKENRPIPSISVNHTIDVNTLGQYTGLKDKNGVEIYEGDIVAINFQRACKTGKAVVKYMEKYASFVLTNTGDVRHEYENLGDYQMGNFEVIGNIYDNPELLKEEKQ